MIKCSDCKFAKVPGVSCSQDHDLGVEGLLNPFGLMAAGFCTMLEQKKPDEEPDEKNDRP